MTQEHFYDHFAKDKPTGFGTWLSKSISQKIFDFAQIQPGESVLEIGPGRGIFADICLKNNIQYSAVEANQQMAEALEEKGANVICSMVPPLPEMDKKFDVVVMVHFIEHMNNMQEALQVALQAKDILKPKGKLVICSPDYLNLRRNFFNCDFSHNFVTTRRRLTQLLISSSFESVKSVFLGGPLSGPLGFVVSAFASRLPFGLLEACFPNCKVCFKLYKLQLTFSRTVLITGENKD